MGLLTSGIKAGERISQRLPTAVASTENPLLDNLVIDTDAIRTGGLLEQNVNALMQTTPGVKTKAKSPEGKLKAYQDHVASNLDFLYRQMPDDVVKIAKDWYKGANKIANGLSNRYGVSLEQSSGVLAALSPQKDWYQNVSLADRVLEGYKKGIDSGSSKPSTDHKKTLKSIYSKEAYAKDVKNILSKPFSDLTDTQKAMWVRSYDQTFHDRGYDIISPSGESMGPMMTEKGNPATTAWGSNTEISKAIKVIENGSIENISGQMGGQHKVRNFYNNIVSPDYAKELPEVADVTMDTHAIAAGHLMPWSGNSPAVSANFATLKGVPSSSVTGAKGTYGINADAYRQFASDSGIMPREGQSVTWEAVRSLYPRKWKNVGNENAILGIWDDYQKGRVNLETARSLILEKAEGIDAPDWARGRDSSNDVRPGSAVRQKDLSGTSLSKSTAKGVDGRTGVNVAGVLSALGISTAGLTPKQATAKDKAVAVGETLLDAGQAMIAPIAAAPHALIPALLSDRPTAQIEQGYQNLLQQQNYEPSTQLGQQYSQQAQQFMGDAFDAAAQSAPGRAAKEFLAPINLLMQQAPDRARLIGRSLLDMSPF